ncbi:MAG: ATP-binding protein [Clostridia bacterium]|nr:ATP-binding protein [Clostridia bacterium]
MPAMNNAERVPKRILSSLLASVSAGVVPRSGAPYIAIGREDEIAALLSDLEATGEGCGTMRFLIGRYGSGKSFLMQLIRGYAMERDFVTSDADLSPERRLYGSGGTGIATYRELIKNMASKSSPDGGALSKIIARWVDGISSELAASGIAPETEAFSENMSKKIYSVLRDMEDLVGGFDFAHVMNEYYRAYTEGSDEKKSACLRWLRGEYSTKTEARNALGFTVSVIIDDDNWYDFIKIWAYLVRRIGYRGFVVFIDECVNLYKITHRISRENNYEKILSMFNDTLQGRAEGLDIILGGTPQFLEDTRRGLFSYEALRSRLCDSRFALGGYKNLIGPVIRLRRLTDEELFALLGRVTKLYAQNYNWLPRISETEMQKFLEICLSRAGADAMITPREMLRDYMTVLNILMQNEKATFEDIVGSGVVTLKYDDEPKEKNFQAQKTSNLSKNDFNPDDIEF